MFTLTYHPRDTRPYWLQWNRVVLVELEDATDAGVLVLNCARLAETAQPRSRVRAWEIAEEGVESLRPTTGSDINLRDRPRPEPRVFIMD